MKPDDDQSQIYREIKSKNFMDALKDLRFIEENKSETLIIHYSTEGFDFSRARPPRICAICIKRMSDGQSKSFSIDQNIELLDIEDEEIESNIHLLEQQLISDFVDFLKENLSKTWIHWEMNGSHYGFDAISKRYEAIAGQEIGEFQEINTIELSTIMKRLYGYDYAPHPRLKKIADLNGIWPLSAYVGKDEARLFADGKYYTVNQSTAAKVSLIYDIFELCITNRLKIYNPKYSKIQNFIAKINRKIVKIFLQVRKLEPRYLIKISVALIGFTGSVITIMTYYW